MKRCIGILIQHGADVNKRCIKGRTPLHDVVAWYCRERAEDGHVSAHVKEKCWIIIRKLIRAGCNHRIMDAVSITVASCDCSL
jgi:hypothetical protein